MLILAQNGDAIIEREHDFDISYFVRENKEAVIQLRFYDDGEPFSKTLGVYQGEERAREIIKCIFASFADLDSPEQIYEMPGT